MFYGRKKELCELEKMYSSGKFEFAVFYGRRRVGKTTLINEFCKDKKVIFFTGAETTSDENLKLFSNAIFETLTENPQTEATFSSFDKLFSFLDSYCQNDRLILVIDEYPYLAKSENSISSILQKHIDHNWKDSNLFLILSGSSMSFMENQVLGYKSPIYGRRTAQFKIKPFTFFEAKNMCSSFSKEEQALFYGITWGIPEYLKHIDSKLSLDENIRNLFFSENGRLFEEPSNLLKQEMRNPASYNSIISAIANGATKLNEISDKTKIESGAASNLIQSLIELGIVKREVPATEKENSRKSIYLLEDSFFHFWYKFVSKNISNISRGIGSLVYEKFVKNDLNVFMGKIFEEICLQFLFTEKGLETLPFLPQKIGRWWGSNPKLKREEEIDILGFDDENVLLCECKWNNQKVEKSVLDDLIEQGNLFSQINKYFFVFSKSGFSSGCQEKANSMENVKLISFAEM